MDSKEGIGEMKSLCTKSEKFVHNVDKVLCTMLTKMTKSLSTRKRASAGRLKGVVHKDDKLLSFNKY